MFCANCGKKVNTSEPICKKCGNEVELNGYIPFFDIDVQDEAAEVEKFEELAELEEIVEVPATVTSERAVGFGTVEDLVPEEDGLFVGKWFIITVIVSICLVIGAVAAIVLFSNSMGGLVAGAEQAQAEAVDENEDERSVSEKKTAETGQNIKESSEKKKQSNSNDNQGIIVVPESPKAPATIKQEAPKAEPAPQMPEQKPEENTANAAPEGENVSAAEPTERGQSVESATTPLSPELQTEAAPSGAEEM